MKYKVGVAQFKPLLFEVDKNLNKMEKMLESTNADLIVFPELATCGYVFATKEEVAKVAENGYSGKTAQLFSRLSKTNNCSYVVGFAEKAKDKYYNSSMLVNPNGEIFIYRKTHLFYEEKMFFEPGNTGFKTFKAKNGVKVGLMICFDWIFPESARTLALNGAEIIAHSANLVLPWCQQAMITRSLENRVFSITSNRTGEEINGERRQFFTGMSQILSTKGEIIHRMNETEESIFITEINPALSNDKMITEFNNAFDDRRVELYR